MVPQGAFIRKNFRGKKPGLLEGISLGMQNNVSERQKSWVSNYKLKGRYHGRDCSSPGRMYIVYKTNPS